MHRVVAELQWAEGVAGEPDWLGVSRGRGAKAKGRQYEKRVAKCLGPSVKNGQWFKYCDLNGLGWCQPDFIVPLKDQFVPSVLVIECKYTWISEAHSQISRLYAPVIRKAWDRKVFGLVVCRNLVQGLDKLATVNTEFSLAVEASLDGKTSVWHWLG